MDTNKRIASGGRSGGALWSGQEVLRQLHRWLGLSLGLLLALMGATGAMMSFEDELGRLMSPGIVTVPAGMKPRLPPSQLIARARAQRQGQAVAALTLYADPARAPQVEFAPLQAGQRRGDMSFIDPYQGRLLGPARGPAFFAAVRRLHRVLALPGGASQLGRRLTGLAALGLVFFALSGLYLRWPRSPQGWRGWLRLDQRGRGPAFQRALHAWVGSWWLLLYLFSAGTGLWWSYDSYRQAVAWVLSGQPPPRRPSLPPAAFWATPPLALDQIWQTYLRVKKGHYRQARLSLPAQAGAVLNLDSVPLGARYTQMSDRFRFDSRDGRWLTSDYYAERSWQKVALSGLLPLHNGSFFGWPGRILLFLSSASMLLLAWSGWSSYLGGRRSIRRLGIAMDGLALNKTAGPAAIVYAGQSGRAQQLARLSAQVFTPPSPLWPLNELTAERLSQAHRLLFVVSTYGDGEPPDTARKFVQQRMSLPVVCPQLEYALLALGDRNYGQFCAFGRRLDDWLAAGGGQPLFERVELDGEDPDGQLRWWQVLDGIGAQKAIGDAEKTVFPFDYWHLCERERLNPEDAENPVYRLLLKPKDGVAMPSWQAGDLAEILPPLRPGERGVCKPREYSIASLPEHGAIELWVRQVLDEQGRLGIGSGWLTNDAPLHASIALRIRSNPMFHAPPGLQPMILIGSGTGLAGLLAQLRQRMRPGSGGPAWLLYGERRFAEGECYRRELEAMRAAGRLERMQLMYSRDGMEPRYVQQSLADQGEELHRWLERGAAIYVCGRLHDMGRQVEACLQQLLGAADLDELAAQGRYRRDVY